MQGSPPSPSSLSVPLNGERHGASEAVPDGAVLWTTHGARNMPGRVAFTVLVVSLTWWMALSAFHSPFIAVVGCLAILGSVAEGLFPVRHRLTASGVSTRCAWQWRTLAWENVKTARMGRDGIHLSPLRASSRLWRVRGVTLRFPENGGPDVTSLVRRYLHEARDGKPNA